jgi:hypothetical protein
MVTTYQSGSSLLPAFLAASIIQSALLVVIVAIEIVRSVHQFEAKFGFVVAYVAVTISTLIVPPFLIVQITNAHFVGIEQRAKESLPPVSTALSRIGQ